MKSAFYLRKVGDCINIIFLDVDGVLNSLAYFKSIGEESKESGFNDISDFHLQMLSKIYHSCNAHIVLTSSWRELNNESDMNVYPMYQYLVESLAKYGMEIMDSAPVVEMNRPLEIKTWLENREDKENIKYVSLDDDFSKEQYDKYGIGNCLVHTRFFCDDVSEGGLQQEHVDKAIKILRGK